MKNGVFKDSKIIAADQQEKEKNFWLNQLAGTLVKSFFPYDFDLGKSQASETAAALQPFEWTGTLFKGLSMLSSGSPYKLHIILLAGITLLLDKYTGNSDIILATPIYKPDTTGKFVNVILPVRTQPGTQDTLKDLLRLVSKTLVAASAHQNYPLEILLEEIGMPPVQGEPSLLDTAVLVDNIHDPGHIRTINPGMIFSFRVTDKAIAGKLEYQPHLYGRTTVTRIIEHLQRLLAKAAENPDSLLSQLEILSKEEKKRILDEFCRQSQWDCGNIPADPCLPGQNIYIVDRYNNLQPPGLDGHVYTAGSALTGGIPDPFIPGQVMVKTGDIARWQPDGTITFSGREENRFTCRGYQVQPEQIEKYLHQIAPINQAVATVAKNENHREILEAYFVTAADLSPAELPGQLAGKLPGHLIPAAFTRLERMPLTPAGKINRNRDALRESAAKIQPAGDMTEEKLTDIWAEVLEIEKENLPADAEFSQFGGQSLKAIMMSTRIHKEFNISIPIPTIFHLATIRRMAQYIQETVKTDYSPIELAEKREYYKLSPGQKRLYLVQQMDPTNTGYNVPQIVILEGRLYREQLEHAFTRLIHMHESFRTSFQVTADQPVQKIYETVAFTMACHDLDQEKNNQEGRKSREITANFIKPFDLAQAPLLKVGLIKENNLRHILMIDRHHIISDATSRGIFLKDLIRLYEGQELPPLKLQYKDYSQWHNSEKQQQALKEQENYWLRQFSTAAGDIPVLNLPLDYPRPAIQSFAGSTIGFSIGQQETQQLNQMTTRENATIFIVLLAIYNIFLSKICGQQDIIVGTPVLGRRHEDLKHIIGIFVNTLAIRNEPAGWKSFKHFLNEVKTNALAAFENQLYPFEELVDRVSVNRDISRNPLFDTVLMQEVAAGPDSDIEDSELKVLPYETQSTMTKFDLTLHISEENNILYFAFQYGTKLFKDSTIHRFTGFFKKIIAEILADNEKKLAEIDIITGSEREQLLIEFNRTHTLYPREKLVHQLFEEQEKKNPDHLAVVGLHHESPGRSSGKDKNTYIAITYRQLNEKANQLARLLREKGVTNDTVVGLVMDPCTLLTITIIGILKAGAAYLPIDPHIPPGRIAYILNESAVPVILSHFDAAQKIPAASKEKLLELQPQTLDNNAPINPAYPCQPGNLAYVIYTSGSTGQPKGVCVEHSQLVNFVYHMYNRNEGNVDAHDRCLALTNIMFDVSVWEFFLPLLFGSRLVILPQEKRFDVLAVSEAILKEGITLMYLPPALLKPVHEVLEKQRRRLKLNKMLVGVEPIRDDTLESYMQLNPHMRIINGYGPTETTICATSYTYISHQPQGQIVPIGQPLANNQVVLMDDADHVVPIGIPGEICISGAGVTRGYLNNPALTNDKYRPHPYFKGKRLYRSGDLARWLPEKNILFIGRKDHQIKLRGYRIELGEIENRLQKHKGIKDVVVTLNQREDEDKYLCAYFTSPPGKTPGPTEIKEYLAAQLPDYMIPTYFIPLGKIPLTTSGKVDKKTLPTPALKSKDTYIPPANRLEEKLRTIWADLLGIKPANISMEADFFELGGHSLNANIMTAKIHKLLEVKLPLAEVFKNRTIRRLAKCIENTRREKYTSIEPVEKKEYYELSSTQRRLYFLQEMEPTNISYNIPLVLPLDREADIHKLETAIKKLIARHESLRTSFDRVKETAVQRIHDPGHLDITIMHYRADNKPEEARITAAFLRPFDLTAAPLLRSGIIHEPGGSRTWLIDLHHIISDGASHVILTRDFMVLNHGKDLPPLRLQYKDFTCWQEKLFASGAIKLQEDYWLELYADIADIPRLDLPADHKRPDVFTYAGDIHSFVLGRETAGKFKKLAAQNHGTLYMNILAALNALFYKYTNQRDIIIGSMIAGRPHADLQQIIGMFVNTLPMRNYPDGEKTYRDFLQEVIANSIRAFANQELQFEELVEKLKPPRDLSRNPLFDITMVVQNLETAPAKDLQDLPLPPIPADDNSTAPAPDTTNKTSKFDMTFFVVERGDEIDITIKYYTGIFKKETIERQTHHFKNLVKTVANEPYIRLADIEIMSQQEKEQVLYAFNDTLNDYPQDMTIHQWFEHQVEKTPDNIALTGVQTGQVTYRELNDKTNRLARRLIGKGVQPDTIVGLMIERSQEMIIGIFAILKAGGAYLPIDPTYPPERIDYMTTDSNGGILLTTAKLRVKVEVEDNPGQPQRLPLQSINIEQELASAFEPLSSTLTSTCQVSPTNLAYIIYTSGSTGKPKGVMIRHRSLINRLNWMQDKFSIDQDDTLLQKTPFTFDVSVWEIFWWSIPGAKLSILPPGGEKDPDLIVETIEKTKVTVLHFVPSMLNAFLEYVKNNDAVVRLQVLKQVIASGEALTLSQVNLFKELLHQTNGTKLTNLYGPTEATVDVSYYDCTTDKSADSIPIGKPIHNIRLYVLNAQLQPQPIGIAGELGIAGLGLARGYLNQPTLTAGKFCHPPGGRFLKKLPPWNPPQKLLINRSDQSYIYLTGDLTRWLPDGNIEFLGRLDHQLKVRGFRIEPGEIENRLLTLETIKETVVLLKESTGGEANHLMAYFVSPREFSATELRTYLASQLPEYMIPTHFVKVDKIPLTPNGKIDRKTLETLGTRQLPGAIYVPPQSDIEKKITQTWKEILRLEKIGIHDNFFDLGGTSFEIIRLNQKLKEIFQVNIPLVNMFRYTTVHLQAAYLEQGEEEIHGREEKLKKGKDSLKQRRQKKKENR